jgi:hypothetical protein
MRASLCFCPQILLNFRMVQVIVLSLISGSLFYDIPVNLPGARTYFGASFLVVLFITFGSFPQMVRVLAKHMPCCCMR